MIGDGACQNDRSMENHRPMSEQSRSVEENLEREDVRHDKRTSRSDKPENSKETAIWYEYGCV